MKINLLLGLIILMSFKMSSATLCTQYLEKSGFINGVYTRMDFSDFGASERLRSRLFERLNTWLKDLESGTYGVQSTIELQQASSYIRTHLIELFRYRKNSLGSYQAWDLAPNLDVARKNLQQYLKTESQPYVTHMTQVNYEKAIDIYSFQGTRVQAVRRLITSGIGYSETQSALQKKHDPLTFAELKRELDLDPQLNATQTFELLRLAYTSKSYESFLISAFADGATKQRIETTLTNLVKIIEVAESIESNEAFSTYLGNKIHNIE